MKYLPILMMVASVGCATTNGTGPAAITTASTPTDVTAETLCDGESNLPPDFAFSEEDFSLEGATRSMAFLTERINPIVSELNFSENAAEVVRDNWEFLYIGRPNALNKINGYLLRQQAETAPLAERAAAVTEFCDFLKATAVTD